MTTLTHQEILTKAIEKAQKSGYSSSTPKEDANYHANHYLATELVPLLIFNHDFAKALWGDAIEDAKTGEKLYKTTSFTGPAIWQHHLQQMVIAPDPIAYLGENI